MYTRFTIQNLTITGTAPPTRQSGVTFILNGKSLVLIVDDPDAPMGTWDHWVVWNISPAKKIEENSVPGTEGLNSSNKHSYGGPCSPSGTHRYFFKVYALDTKLELKTNSRKKDVENAIGAPCEVDGVGCSRGGELFDS